MILLPTTGAVTASRLEGELTFAKLHADAANLSSVSLGALSLLPDTPLDVPAPWTLAASAVTVNWTLREHQGVGFTPDGGQSLFFVKLADQSGEDYYTGPSVSMEPQSPSVNFLLAANGSTTRVSGLRTGPLEISPSAGESWFGGASGWAQDAVANGSDINGRHDVAKGMPKAQFTGADGIEVRGDFSLYVWAALVNVTAANGTTHTYRSGEWDSDVVGGQVHERGVTRKENGQLVRLDVTEGVLVMASWKGLARLGAPGIEAHVEGDALLTDATGYFESDRYYFRAQNESVGIGGSVSVSARPHPASRSHLIATLTATGAETSIQPSGPLAAAAPGPAAGAQPASAADAGASLPLPQSEWSVPALLAWIAFGALLASAGGLYVWRRRAQPGAAQDVEALLQRAEGALVRGDSATARAYARPVLRRQRANVDAWFVHGASLLREGAHGRAVKDLEAAMKGIRVHRAALAFLLTISYLNLGRLGAARRWARVAASDPEFRAELDTGEQFAPLRRRGPAMAAAADRRSLVDAAYG